MSDPWRAQHYGTGYSAEWLPVGQFNWRVVKGKDGKVKVFPSGREALAVAKERFLKSLAPEIRATLPADPDRMADKLKAEAESWLKSSRQDVKKAETHYRPGKKPFKSMRGRA